MRAKFFVPKTTDEAEIAFLRSLGYKVERSSKGYFIYFDLLTSGSFDLSQPVHALPSRFKGRRVLLEFLEEIKLTPSGCTIASAVSSEWGDSLRPVRGNPGQTGVFRFSSELTIVTAVAHSFDQRVSLASYHIQKRGKKLYLRIEHFGRFTQGEMPHYLAYYQRIAKAALTKLDCGLFCLHHHSLDP